MKQAVIFLIKCYQNLFSGLGVHVCRFSPSCSNYMMGCIKKSGLGKGIVLGIKRILRCHPFSPGGCDPVK